MTHRSHVKFISFNATMLNGSLGRTWKTALIDQRAVAAGKKPAMWMQMKLSVPYQLSLNHNRRGRSIIWVFQFVFILIIFSLLKCAGKTTGFLFYKGQSIRADIKIYRKIKGQVISNPQKIRANALFNILLQCYSNEYLGQ